MLCFRKSPARSIRLFLLRNIFKNPKRKFSKGVVGKKIYFSPILSVSLLGIRAVLEVEVEKSS